MGNVLPSLRKQLFASLVTPQEWAAFSNANIQKAERERNNSVALRASIDGILKQTADDMKTQCDAVNLSFKERVAETKKAKDKLEQHLDKVFLFSAVHHLLCKIGNFLCCLHHVIAVSG